MELNTTRNTTRPIIMTCDVTQKDSAKSIRPIDLIFIPFCREIQDEEIRLFHMFLRRSEPTIDRKE